MLMQIFWICLLSFLGFGLFGVFKQWFRAVITVLRLPGPPIIPFFGNIFNTEKNQDFLETLSTVYNKYGGIVGGWILFYPVVFVLEPKHIQSILSSSKLVDKELFYNVLDSIAGTGLVTSNVDKWRFHRKCIQPLFKINILEGYLSTISDCSQALVKRLENVKEIRLTSTIQKFILDVLHEIVLGIPADDQITQIRSPFLRGQNTSIERLLRPWLMANVIHNLTKASKDDELQQKARDEFVSEALCKIEEKNKNGTQTKQSLLKLLMEISDTVDNFSRSDVIDEACTFMLAGQDATGVNLSFTLYYLAKHQDIQQKVADEVNNIHLNATEISMTALNKMKFLGQCIKESLRLSPAVPLIARKLTEDVELDDVVVPAGCNVFISPYATHRLPHYYPNPEQFDPDRFLDVNKEKLNKFSYIPFSAGPRNCIGFELAMLTVKAAICELLRSYRIYLAPGREQLSATYRITIKIKGGIWLMLEPRPALV